MLLNVKSEVGRKWSSLPEGACKGMQRRISHGSRKQQQLKHTPYSLAIMLIKAVSCIPQVGASSRNMRWGSDAP